MKHYILFFFALLLAGCGSKASQPNWPITPKNETAAQLIKLDSISRAIMANSNMDNLAIAVANQLDMQVVDDLGLRQQRDTLKTFTVDEATLGKEYWNY